MKRLRHIVLLILGIGILIADDTPEEFQYETSTLQAFYYFTFVAINGVEVDSNDWVGAFNGDICVGSRQWDTSGYCSDSQYTDETTCEADNYCSDSQYADETSCLDSDGTWTSINTWDWNQCGGGVCDLPVMGYGGSQQPETEGYMTAGEFPTFKIYDVSENTYYDAIPSEDIPWQNFGFNTIDELNGSILGCTDLDACNYDADATQDDDSCEYATENYDCDENCITVVDCSGECGGSAVVDECGECNGDGIDEGACDCDGNVEDCTGECGGSAVIDNCGVCGGSNTECWFVDITTSIGDVEDSESRIGMHTLASDEFNAADPLIYEIYEDEVDFTNNSPTNYIDFYFPHPEWAEDIEAFIGSYAGTDLRKDIRHFEVYTMSSFDSTTSIIVDNKIYYIQQQWDIEIDTDQNLSNGNNVKLDFNFVNDISNSGAFAKIFFYRKISGNSVIEEMTQNDNSIILHDYELLSDLRIILGTDTAQPKVTAVSPLPNEIFSLENDNFFIELNMENPDEIGVLNFFFEVNGNISNTISVQNAEQWHSEDGSSEQFDVYIDASGYYAFLNTEIGEKDFIDNVNIFIEIVDKAGNTGAGNGYDIEELGPLTFSRNENNISIETGWHLLSSPLAGDDGENMFEDLFLFPTYDCSDWCDESDVFDPYETANSGTGFYVETNGEIVTFTGNVLSQFSSILDQGWNLIGNPLVTSIDISSLLITYENMDYTADGLCLYNDCTNLSWWQASDMGIISPTPIIYNNEIGSHTGTLELPIAAGFWVHSFYDNVEISFIPSNPPASNDSTRYWSLSLFAKENMAGYNFDNSIGSEIVIGIHEDADDSFVSGEDQEIFPLSEIDIFNSYSELGINNGGQMLYRDIRSYDDPVSTWDISVESINPFSDEGIVISWEKQDANDPYEYYICDEYGSDCYDMTSTGERILEGSENIKIKSVLKELYIGCTNPLATNYDPDALGGNEADYCDLLSLLLPEEPQYLDEGDSFNLPIELVNPHDSAIVGLHFVIEYDAAMIMLNPPNLSENFSQNFGSNYTFYQSEGSNGQFSTYMVYLFFTGESGSVFSAEDILFDLSGQGINDGFTTISLSSVQINENYAFSNSCDIKIGIEYLTLTGELNYYKNEVPLPGGSISIEDSYIDFATDTYESGNFIIDSLIADFPHELIISKDEYSGDSYDYFDGLSAVDASRIARHAVNRYNFSPNEIIAANINFDYRCEYDAENGSGAPHYTDGVPTTESVCNNIGGVSWMPNISSLDASRVARYAVGIIEDLDDECDPHWVFLNPVNEIMIHDENCNNLPNASNFVRNYTTENLESDDTLKFQGIRLGDVTGNWTAPLSRENDQNIVENPMVELEVGQVVKLPLYLPNKVEIEGVDFTIQYDPEVFTFVGFNNNNSILDKSTYNTIINDDVPGIFKLVSYANSSLINDYGLLGYVKFKVVSHTTSSSTIHMDEMKINDVQQGGFLVDGNFESNSIAHGVDFQISAIPDVFALNKNYPNPFNPSTNINFELPYDGNVKIFIYDLKGSLVDELVDGYMEAGYYNLKWDGSRKASGIYFIQMIADNGSYIKMTKMMLVK